MSILVTGGTKGIGRAIAERFSASGVKVFLAYSSDDAAAMEASAAIAAKGGEPFLFKGDVGSPETCAALVDRVARETPVLDQVVHCAVVAPWGPLLEVDSDELAQAVRVNALALVDIVREARPLLTRGSTVVAISSRGSARVVPGYGPVGVAKALMESAMRYLAVELAPDGIRTHVVEITAVLTSTYRAIVPDAENRIAEIGARSPAGRGVTTDDIADAVEWLASDRAAMITGRPIVLDGASNLLV
jgi:NAD(P)-dependent dehydrogenase (short-subunit alcohol dehydrogenase family)